MQKMPFFFFFIIFLVYSQISVAQNNDRFEKLVGKRWGLSYFIEQNANVYDTLLRGRNCNNEYMEITANGRFLSSDLDKEGTWTLKDNTLLLKKASGLPYKLLTITKLTHDSLIVTDKKKKSDDVFIEVYKVCDINDTTFTDTREIKQINKNWGFVFGAQDFAKASVLGTALISPYIELGISRSRVEWNGVVYAASLNFETAPWRSIYGTSLNFWSEDFFFYGVGVTNYFYPLQKSLTNTETKNIFGFRPMLGLSSARWLKEEGLTIHLIYSYNFFLGQNEIGTLNRHAIHLRCLVPIIKNKQAVRRIVREHGNDY
jgi:hypothetical protein